MTDRELLHKALDALSQMRSIDLMQAEALDLPETIRLRLAEPEEAVEPVGWTSEQELVDMSCGRMGVMQPETGKDDDDTIPVYLHPSRPAVRLSDEEIRRIHQLNGLTISSVDWLAIEMLSNCSRAIEAAVLKKNNLGE